MAVDWLKIKTEYINGDISYRKLAEKHGIPLRTIAKHAKDEDWQQSKEIHCNDVATTVQQKTVEKISDALSEEAATKVKIRGMLWQMTQNWLAEQGDRINDVGDFRKIVQSCVDLGIMEVQEPEEYDGDGLIEALTANAGDLFDDGDDSDMLPEEEET